MRKSRTLKALAVFYVGKDEKVALLDLKVLGLRTGTNRGELRSRYSKYFRLLDEMASSLGIGDGLAVSDMVCYYHSKPVLCRLYKMPFRREVIYILLSSFQPGIIGRLSATLESNYWKRLFLLEIAGIRQSSLQK